jgi:hypothetical protein
LTDRCGADAPTAIVGQVRLDLAELLGLLLGRLRQADGDRTGRDCGRALLRRHVSGEHDLPPFVRTNRLREREAEPLSIAR